MKAPYSRRSQPGSVKARRAPGKQTARTRKRSALAFFINAGAVAQPGCILCRYARPAPRVTQRRALRLSGVSLASLGPGPSGLHVRFGPRAAGFLFKVLIRRRTESRRFAILGASEPPALLTGVRVLRVPYPVRVGLVIST